MTIDTIGARMIDVASSNLSRVGYSSRAGRPACDGTLYVQFLDRKRETRDGALYAYDDVPHHVYVGLLAAESPGGFFHEHVKKVGYGFRRIG